MTNATLLTDGARPAVRLERDLPDAPRVVWRALTDRTELRAWFPCDVIVAGGTWQPGASIVFRFEEHDMTLTGEVLEVDEPRVLAFTWGEDRLRFEMSPRDGGTRLVLVDELPPGAAARNAAGWEVCLDRLVGVDSEASWQPRFDRYAAEFAPVVGEQEGPPVS
jgi:uncharacterized protein YndB with AHSA1/START domain